MGAVVATALVLVCAAGASPEGVNLASLDGWDIVVSQEASPSEAYAAEQFQALLEQAVAESGSITLPEGLDADLETEAYGCPCSWHLREAAVMAVWPVAVKLKRPSELEVVFPEDAAGARWLRLLIHWGAELRIPPPEFPNDALPLICIAKCHRSCIELLCISYGGLLGRTDELVNPPKSYDPAARYACFELMSEGQALWEEPKPGTADSWTVTLRVGDTAVAIADLSK